jgi:hypothetical protein
VLPVPVPLDVFGRYPQHRRVVAEESQAVVASLAEQLPHVAGVMVMIEMSWASITADRATVVLGCPECIKLHLSHLVRPVEVAHAVRCIGAAPAPATEAGARPDVARVVLDSHSLLA